MNGVLIKLVKKLNVGKNSSCHGRIWKVWRDKESGEDSLVLLSLCRFYTQLEQSRLGLKQSNLF
jgi:hypothetical protein